MSSVAFVPDKYLRFLHRIPLYEVAGGLNSAIEENTNSLHHGKVPPEQAFGPRLSLPTQLLLLEAMLPGIS